MRENIGVIGLGYIGLPLLGALANAGYNVIGLDINEEKIKNLQQTYKADIHEPGLNEILQRYKHIIEFTTDYGYLMERCDTLMVTVGTPLRDDNSPDHRYIDATINSIGTLLRWNQLIILRSTVPIGTTEQVALKLEQISGLKAGEDFYLAFCPERTTEGLALHEIQALPKIIGGVNTKSMDRTAAILERLGSTIIKVSSPEIAETCKLIDNAYRALNIAFANEVGYICEKFNIDSYEVVSAVNYGYERTNLFRAGLGAGGACLSKDPQILLYCAEKLGLHLNTVKASLATNIESTLRIESAICHFINAKGIRQPKISFLGLAFKGMPETDDIRYSPAVVVYQALQRDHQNAEFKFYDPIIRGFLSNRCSLNLEECVRDSNIVLLLTNHPQLMNLDVKDILSNAGRPLLIIDCWHNVRNLEQQEEVQILRIGDGKLWKY